MSPTEWETLRTALPLTDPDRHTLDTDAHPEACTPAGEDGAR